MNRKCSKWEEKTKVGMTWWHTPVIIAVGRLKAEGYCNFDQSGLQNKTLLQKV